MEKFNRVPRHNSGRVELIRLGAGGAGTLLTFVPCVSRNVTLLLATIVDTHSEVQKLWRVFKLLLRG